MTKLKTFRILPVAMILVLPEIILASGKAQTSPIWGWLLSNIIPVMAVLLIVVVLFTLWNLMNGMVDVQQKDMLKEQGIALSGTKKVKKDSLLKRLYDKSWSLVPMEQEADIQLDHDYDGIKELDNRLPPWWVYMFYLTILFGVGYLYIYHFSDIGMSQHEEYTSEMDRGEQIKRDFLARQSNSVDESNVTVLTDAASLSDAESIFKANCAACHGQLGEGGVGPNLTDKYWVHGGGITNVFKVIKHGVPEKGMIAWKAQLQPTTIQKLASYILTLEGTDPPNQKEKQGELYVPDAE